MTKQNIYHTPVLLHECIESLQLQSSDIIIDGTIGLGGHSEEIIKKILPSGLLIGIDQDENNLMLAKKRLRKYSKNIKFIHDNFLNFKNIIQENNIKKVNGILLDLGIASTHVDDSHRGFSYMNDGPLDMRMNQDQVLTAKTVVNSTPEKKLAEIIYKYGEEKKARLIARAITKERKRKKITRTQDLTTVINAIVKNKHQNKNASCLTFQALRIYVNNELEALKEVLSQSLELLSPGRRLAVISYHSLEDRIVKHFFKEQARHCICPKEFPICICNHKAQIKIITSSPITPTANEISANPRSRSAKLRIAEKL